jgi:hypothetical protein
LLKPYQGLKQQVEVAIVVWAIRRHKNPKTLSGIEIDNDFGKAKPLHSTLEKLDLTT